MKRAEPTPKPNPHMTKESAPWYAYMSPEEIKARGLAPNPTPELTADGRKLQWREACDGGSWWWMMGDPDTDVILTEGEHAAVAAIFEETARMAEEEGRGYRSAAHGLAFELFATKLRGRSLTGP